MVNIHILTFLLTFLLIFLSNMVKAVAHSHATVIDHCPVITWRIDLVETV